VVAGRGGRALAALAQAADDDLSGAVEALSPVLGEYWSEGRPAERAVSEAVERLRVAAKIRPGKVRDARLLAGPY
jgi:hypothetical protein